MRSTTITADDEYVVLLDDDGHEVGSVAKAEVHHNATPSQPTEVLVVRTTALEESSVDIDRPRRRLACGELLCDPKAVSSGEAGQQDRCLIVSQCDDDSPVSIAEEDLGSGPVELETFDAFVELASTVGNLADRQPSKPQS